MTDPNLNSAFDPMLLSRIEDASLNASAPTEQLWIDGWLVRFCPGKAKRARSVNAVAAGRGDVPGRIQACADVYARAGLPPVFRMTPFSQPTDLDARLAALGMARLDDTRVLVLSGLASAVAGTPVTPVGMAISVRGVGTDAFAHRVGGFRGSSLALRQAHADRMRHSPVPPRAFELFVHSEPAACGQFVVEGDLVGLYDVHTAATHRGLGIAGHLCRHLLQLAEADGARHAYLQVEADNLAARAVYRRIGFVEGYRYHYRWHPPERATP